MNLPRIAVIVAPAVTDMNRICEAMGLGTPYFTRKLCAVDPLADHNTPATHYLASDMSALAEDNPEWQAMATAADLPAIQGIWGENGVISAQDAQAVLAPGNLQVYTAAGLDPNNTDGPTEFRNGIFAGLGLQFVPDEPI